MQKEIERLKNEAKDLEKKAELLEHLLVTYPDLERFTDRWHREYFCSKKVNEQATEYESCHSCGCCSDSALLIKPYIIDNTIRIYTNPYCVAVGEKGYRGDIPHREWEDRLRKAGYRQEIIDGVTKHFKCDNENKDEDF